MIKAAGQSLAQLPGYKMQGRKLARVKLNYQRGAGTKDSNLYSWPGSDRGVEALPDALGPGPACLTLKASPSSKIIKSSACLKLLFCRTIGQGYDADAAASKISFRDGSSVVFWPGSGIAHEVIARRTLEA